MQRRGYIGTGLADILAQAEAPRGSLYYHFPGGKREIAIEAVRYSGRIFGRDLERIAAESCSLDAYFSALAALSKRDLIATDYDAGCPVAATALDVPNDEHDILDACALAFSLWSDAIAEALRKHGMPCERAAKLGPFFVNTLLGATMSARAFRGTAVIDEALHQLRRLS